LNTTQYRSVTENRNMIQNKIFLKILAKEIQFEIKILLKIKA